MQALKIILIIAVLCASLGSCKKLDFEEDEVLTDPANDTKVLSSGGEVNEGE